MADKRLVAALPGDGRIVPVEQEIPPLKPGAVLIEVHNSLVSPGTELQGGWRALKAQKDKPEPKDAPAPFGYSNAGVVLKTGEGVDRFQPGDRVACVGAGYAQHATHAVVPHNLCFRLPEAVTFPQATYAMLAGTALHAVRRGDPELGEYAAVVGLGIVGQLAAQFLRLAGNYVVGWDLIELRTRLAADCGIHRAVQVGPEDATEATNAFTDGAGLDAAILALAGNANPALKSLVPCFKKSPDTHRMGRIVVVGGVQFDYPGSPPHNMDIRHSGRTGPGYHDDDWEYGPDYPPVFMRWTTRTNMEFCLRLIAEGRLAVDALTTHTVPLAEVESGIDRLMESPDDALGVIFRMK